MAGQGIDIYQAGNEKTGIRLFFAGDNSADRAAISVGDHFKTMILHPGVDIALVPAFDKRLKNKPCQYTEINAGKSPIPEQF